MRGAKAFIDTNVFFYAFDSADPEKKRKASELLVELAESGRGQISVQVATELAANLVRKLGVKPGLARELLRGLDDYAVVPTSTSTVQRALDLMAIASLSIWDAMILASAEAGQCDVIYSEDLSAGQVVAGVRIVNPFA